MTRRAGTHLADSLSAPIIRLAEQLASSIPQPFDPFETAAVAESLGITDDVAWDEYGEPDTFSLARHVFPLTVEIATRRRTGDGDHPHSPAGKEELERPRLADAAMSPVLALVPLVLLLLTTRLLADAGWRIGPLLALSFGVSGAMLLTAGPLLALGRRGAIYRGFGYRSAELRLLRTGAVALLALAAVAAAAAYAGARELASPHEAAVFGASVGGFAAVWTLATTLVLGRRRWWLSGAVAVAVAAAAVPPGVGIGLGAVPLLAIAAGAGGTALLLGVLWPEPDDGTSLRVPRIGLLTTEALPYVAYGFAATALLLEPHLLAWVGRHPHASGLGSFRSFELSLTLALPPLVLSAALLERLLGDFWARARDARHADVAEVAAVVEQLRRAKARVYLATLALLTGLNALALTGVWLARGSGAVDLLVFGCGLAAYALFGHAQLTCLLMLGLARPADAALPFVAAFATGGAVGIPLALIDVRLVALAFVVAGLGAVAASAWRWRRFLAGIDHFYASAF